MNDLGYPPNEKPLQTLRLQGFTLFGILSGGELGIRTPGPVTVNSFQDCRNRPLCQLSGAKVGRETEFCKNTSILYGETIGLIY